MKKKRVGDWILLDTEDAPSFLQYAERTKKGSDGYRHYNKSIFSKVILPYCKKTEMRTAIDIGSSYGFFGEGLAQNFKTVRCFEVIPFVRECCEYNLRSFENVKVFDAGLGSSIGVMDINFYPYYTGHSSVEKAESFKQTSHKIPCPIVPLDLFKYEEVDFIKIDVEGFELEVLRGSVETIRNNSPLILVELLKSQSNAIYNVMMVQKFMSNLDYELVHTHEDDYLFAKKV